MQKVLITGYKGFIGSNLYKSLHKQSEYTLSVFDRNQDIQKVLNIVKPDVVIHLAANPLTTVPLGAIIKDNLYLTQRLVEAMPLGSHLIFASSATVYGDISKHKDLSAREGCDYRSREDSPTVPISVYGTIKLACEAIINAHVLANKIHASILRLVANVGPGATHGMLPDLCYKFDKDEVISPIGKHPGTIKPYMHVDDTVKAIEYVLHNTLCGTYNVGPDDNVSIMNVLDIIGEHRGVRKVISWNTPTWTGDNLVVSVTGAKLRSKGYIAKYQTSKEAIHAAISG